MFYLYLLISLLQESLQPVHWLVLYDGVDIRKLNIEKLNEMSSVIHQNVYMFDDSIQNNICLHKQIASTALQKALDMSGVTMFLGEEKTLDTPVGENGNNLSGGQRQRVALIDVEQLNMVIINKSAISYD